MIERKKKKCKCGCEKEGYIWSKGMLKDCYFKVHPTVIKKIGKKAKQRLTTRKSEGESVRQRDFFMEIWEERPHISEVSGVFLGDIPYTYFFDHAIEKSSHPELKFTKRNIILCTLDEHYKKTNGFPLPRHKELIEQIKEELL